MVYLTNLLSTKDLGTIVISNPFESVVDGGIVLPDIPRSSPSAGKNSAAEQGLEIPMGWKPTAKEPVPVVRCTAMSSTTGERCKRWSLRGTTVCVRHGGQLPSVIAHSEAVVESARMRLMGLADVAVDGLEELMRPGVADAIRIKAIENVLNRAGIRDGVDVSIEVNHNVSAASTIADRLKSIAARSEPAEEIIDAEVVDNEPSVE